MKPLTVFVIIWAIFCLCFAFMVHEMFYNVFNLILIGLWAMSVVFFIMINETEPRGDKK